MSAVFEWLPWFPGRFWGSARVLRLSSQACNLYRWMLDYQWSNGGIPDDINILRRLYPWSDDLTPECYASVREFFKARNGVLQNDTMRKAIADSKRVYNSRSRAGKASVAARRKRDGTAQPPARTPIERRSDECTIDARTLNGSERNGTERKKSARRAQSPPGGREPEPEGGSPLAGEPGQAGRAQARYDAFRREQGWSSLNATSWAEIVRQIGAQRVEEAVSNAIANGWRTLHAPKRDPFGSRLEDYPLVTATHDGRVRK